MNSLEVLQKYGKAIHESPSPFHATEICAGKLDAAGFKKLKESDTWELQKNQGYYVIRENSSIIAFKTSAELSSNAQFRIIGSHTDSPCFKLKSNPTKKNTPYTQLNVEMYGGVLINTWLDRDIKLSGLVVGLKEGEIQSQTVKLPWTFRIPQLAIHLDRDIRSEGLKLNPQTHMIPIAGLEDIDNEEWKSKLSNETHFEEILSWDLCFHDSQEPSLSGMNEEFFISPRLDNLAMMYASTYSLIQSQASSSLIPMMVSFNHEEVGSNSHEGAKGSFLESTLERISLAFQWDRHQFLESMPQSLFMSADMAHAIHPNYKARHDSEHRPLMNHGPVLKTNVNQSYATSASSAAHIRLLAQKAQVPLQDFHSRNDMGCGSTIGPSSSARLGIPGLDIGNAMLSMHSIREMCGTEDFEHIEVLMKKFYEY